jgi:hypothetical protein
MTARLAAPTTPFTASRRRRSIRLRTSVATTPIAVGARPTLANQFADISSWKSGGQAPRFAVMDFDGDAAVTIDSPTNGSTGPELWAIVNGNIRLLGSTKARPIVIAGDLFGYDEETEDAGIATGLYMAGTVTGGNATVSFIPAEDGSL